MALWNTQTMLQFVNNCEIRKLPEAKTKKDIKSRLQTRVAEVDAFIDGLEIGNTDPNYLNAHQQANLKLIWKIRSLYGKIPTISKIKQG